MIRRPVIDIYEKKIATPMGVSLNGIYCFVKRLSRIRAIPF